VSTLPDGASNAYQKAIQVVSDVDSLVDARITDAVETSRELQTAAMRSIEALSSLQLEFPTSGLPPPPRNNFDITVDLQLPEITPTSFGTVTSRLPSAPALDGMPVITPLNIPPFQSSIGSLNIPDPPPWFDPGAVPTRPVTGEVNIPTEPNIVLPPVPTLQDLQIPAWPGLTLPQFDASTPEFEGTALPGILQWTEPTYRPELLGEVIERIRELWSGGSGIPPAVEQAMFERAMSREDTIANREIAAVAEEFSQRGFTAPTGMQAARADQMRQELAVKKLGFQREMTIKIAEWQVENIRFAVEQAIAAENVLVNIFLNAAQRMFEAARFQVESQISIYNAQVALFNARMQGFGIRAQVFDTLVRAELSKLEVFKAEIEAALARGQLNELAVRIYTARIQAVQTEVETFRARMQGAQTQADVIRSQIEAYKADVQAYGETVQAQKIRFDAYEAQVRGEAAKAGIIDAEARGYAAMISGESAKADVDIKRAELIIQRNRVKLEKFVAELDKEKTSIQTQGAVIGVAAQAYTADTQRYIAVAGAETSKAQLEVSAQEAEIRANVSYYQARVQAYLGHMEQLIRQASLVVDALRSAGQLSSTLAAGAMAGVHVGATLSGSAGVSGSGSDSSSYSFSRSESKSETRNENINYNGGAI